MPLLPPKILETFPDGLDKPNGLPDLLLDCIVFVPVGRPVNLLGVDAPPEPNAPELADFDGAGLEIALGAVEVVLLLCRIDRGPLAAFAGG